MGTLYKKPWTAFFICMISILSLLIGRVGVSSATDHFPFNSEQMSNSSVLFWGTLQVFGQAPDIGDEIGVFAEGVTTNNGCIGSTVIDSQGAQEFFSVDAYGDDITSEKTGALPGDVVTFKLWKASNGEFYDLVSAAGGEATWTQANDDVRVDLIVLGDNELRAGFTPSASSGCAPLSIQFDDTSTGDPTSWNWSFGDGTESLLQDPNHTYPEEGTYVVTLTVTNDSSSSDTSTQAIEVVGAPSAEFAANKTSGTLPLAVSFNDQSEGNPTSWEWNFGDGSPVSNSQNPTHTYQQAGKYTVTLKVTSACDEDIEVKEDFITVSSASSGLKADFHLDVTEGCSPFIVHFSDQSEGNPTSWLWHFGDGNSSTAQNPVYEYVKPGLYNIRLTIENALDEHSIERPNLIFCTHTPPQADFEADLVQVCPNTPVQFTDKTTGTPSLWRWSFGDDSSSNDQNPVHTFQKPGLYAVRLMAINPCGSSVKQKAGFIEVLGTPKADFQDEKVGLCSELSIKFTDASDSTITSWQWDFGDGATSSDPNPVHPYDQPGVYTVTLTASSPCASSTRTREVVVTGVPTADFTFPVFGTVGQRIQFVDQSSGEPTDWQWIFGDNSGEIEEKNPYHTYDIPGKYTVSIGVSNSCGSHVTSRTIIIGRAGEACFTMDSDTVCSNMPIQFNNVSDPNFDTWQWNFGDGGVSSEQDPSYYFESAGTYQVKLIASNGQHSHEYQEEMVVLESPKFSIESTIGCVPFTVQCNDLTSQAIERNWDFGDGQTSTEQSPVHTYHEVGTYTINLNYANGCGSAQEVTVKVENPPQADFTVDKMIGKVPFQVTFEDASTGAESLIWDFGDGVTSQEQNPSHTYEKPGLHEVSLTARSNACDHVKTLKGIEVYLTGTIKGKVSNVETSQPVAGARIQVLGHSREVLTDAKGDYAIPDLRSGHYALCISAEGYQTAYRQEILVRSTEETEEDISLSPAQGIISGIVTGPGDAPVVGAAVVALCMDGEEPYSCRAVSDDEGKYSIYLGREGTFKLVASAGEYLSKIDDNQGAGFMIDSHTPSLSGCNFLMEPRPWQPEVTVSSLEVKNQTATAGQTESQTRIVISMEQAFTGDVQVNFDPEFMNDQVEGSLSQPQCIDSNQPCYEVIYSGYTGTEAHRVGLSIQFTMGENSCTMPYVFAVNSGVSGQELNLKGISRSFVPAEGGRSGELGWIDLNNDGQMDVYDKSLVEIPACCLRNTEGIVDLGASPLVARLARVSAGDDTWPVAIYDVELLDRTGEPLDGWQVDDSMPIVVHLQCDPAGLGMNSGNLVIKYQDEEGVWRKDGIKNVHLAHDTLIFTTNHLTRFALLPANSEPTRVVAQVASRTQIDLSWKDNSENELGFEIWQCVGQDYGQLIHYNLLTITDPNVTSFSDLNCTFGDTYHYMVRAITELGDTAYSVTGGKSLTDCEFIPDTPQELKGRWSASDNQIVLEWKDMSACENGFDIFRRIGPNGEYIVIGQVTSNVNTFIDTDVSFGNIYYYLVRATSNVGDSDPSNELRVSAVSKPKSDDGETCFLSTLDSPCLSFRKWIKKMVQW